MPAPLHFAKSDAITSFSCGSTSYCALGLMTLAHVFSLYVSSDGGSSWNLETTPSTWTTLTSLTCQLRRCVAVATTTDSSELVRSTTFTRTWKVAKAHTQRKLCRLHRERTLRRGWSASQRPGVALIGTRQSQRLT